MTIDDYGQEIEIRPFWRGGEVQLHDYGTHYRIDPVLDKPGGTLPIKPKRKPGESDAAYDARIRRFNAEMAEYVKLHQTNRRPIKPTAVTVPNDAMEVRRLQERKRKILAGLE